MLANTIIRQFITQIIGLICGFATSIITARILGPEGRGEFSLILNTSGFLCLFLGFSFASSIIHVISAKKMSQRNIVNTFVFVILVLSVVCSLFLLAFPFSKFKFFLPSNQSEHHLFYLLVLLTLFIITMFHSLYSAMLSGNRLFLQQQKAYIFVTLFSTSLYILLFYLKVKLAIDLHHFILFYIGISILPAIGAFYMYYHYARERFTLSFLDLNQLKYVVNFSLLAYLCNVFQFLSYRMDFWFVEYYNGSSQLGLYSLAVNLAQMIWLLPQAISTILLSYSGSEQKEKGIQNIKTLSRVAILLILVAAFVLAVTIHIIIPLLYGRAFEGSIPLFRILLLGIIPFSITTILASYFAGTGQMKVNLYCSLIGFLVCFIFDLVLIPKYGPHGAAFATCVAYLASTAFIVYVFIRKTHSKLSDLLIFKQSDFEILKTKFISLRQKKG